MPAGSLAAARSRLETATVVVNSILLLALLVANSGIGYVLYLYGDRLHADDEGLLAQHYTRMVFIISFFFAMGLAFDMVPSNMWVTDPVSVGIYYMAATLVTFLQLAVVRALPQARV